ncbi:GD20443 [Drosophila simulans]|uniref:GD20443 n=1 Tax=Drosophila simulans TaxID=7240 RepID=B4R0G4_DROSI|nr:GD20443 [Drosophila simulans]
MSTHQLVTVLLLVSLTNLVLGQLPRNGCSGRFQYQGYQGQYIGLVEVRHPEVNNQTLILQFSQQGYHDFEDYVGSISLVDNDEVTQENLRQGLPIRYRVDFPIPTIPPKIISMQLNGVQLCSGGVYPKPRTGITLRITWTPSYISVFGVNPQPVPTRPRPAWQDESPQIDYRETRPSQPRLEDNGELFGSTNESLPAFQNPGWGTAPQQANPNRGITSQPEIPSPVPQRPTPNPSRSNAPQQAARNPVDLVPQQNPSSNGIPCGRERASTTPLIFQGKSLQRGQLPWLVAIFERRESNGPAFICGGTLISTSTVLSAAHCFRAPGRDLPASRLAVSLGRNTLAIHSDGEFRGVSQLIIHENFQFKQFTEADLALVRLDEPVRYTDYIVPICLWSTSNRMELAQGLKSYVAGWGPDETGTGNTEVSKVTDLNIVSEANLRPGAATCSGPAELPVCQENGSGSLRQRWRWTIDAAGTGCLGAAGSYFRRCDQRKGKHL